MAGSSSRHIEPLLPAEVNVTIVSPAASANASALAPLPKLDVLSAVALADASAPIPLPKLDVVSPVGSANGSGIAPTPLITLPSVVASALATPPNYRQKVIADQAKVFWHDFSTGASVANDEIGTADGTFAGGVVLGVPGPTPDGDFGFTLDGVDDRIDVANNSALDLHDAWNFTIEFWLKGPRPSAAGLLIDHLGNAENSGFQVTVNPNGNIVFLVGWWGLGLKTIVAAGAMPDDTRWHHYSLSNTFRFSYVYRDGFNWVAENLSDAGNPVLVSGVNLVIGRGRDGSSPLAITAAEIAFYENDLEDELDEHASPLLPRINVTAPAGNSTANGIASLPKLAVVTPAGQTIASALAPLPKLDVVSPAASADAQALAPTLFESLLIQAVAAEATALGLSPTPLLALLATAGAASAEAAAPLLVADAAVEAVAAETAAIGLAPTPVFDVLAPAALVDAQAPAPVVSHDALVAAVGAEASALGLSPTPVLAMLAEAGIVDAEGIAPEPLLRALAPAASATASEATSRVIAERDAWVGEAEPDDNHGTATSLQVEGFVGDLRRAYFDFVPSTAARGAVKLRLYLSLNDGDGLAVYAVPDTSWSESLITWNTKPDLDVLLGVIRPTSTGWVELDVSDYLFGKTHVSFALVALATSDEFRIASRESPGFEPHLSLCTVVPKIAVELPAGYADALGIPSNPRVMPLAVTGSAYATLAGVGADADSYVVQVTPSTNYGTATVFGCRRASGTNIIDAYLRFVVSGWQPGHRAILRLFPTVSHAGVSVYAVADTSWGESTITWNNRPAYGSLLGSTGALTANNWVEIDVSAYITGDGTYSLALATTAVATATFSSREAVVGAPQLRLGPVPKIEVGVPPGIADAYGIAPAIHASSLIAAVAAQAAAYGIAPQVALAVLAPLAEAAASALAPLPLVTVLPSAGAASAEGIAPDIDAGLSATVVVPAALADALAVAPIPLLRLLASPAFSDAFGVPPTPTIDLTVPAAYATAHGLASSIPRLVVAPAALATALGVAPLVGSITRVVTPAALASALGLSPVPRIIVFAPPGIANASAAAIAGQVFLGALAVTLMRGRPTAVTVALLRAIADVAADLVSMASTEMRGRP